MEDDDKDKPVTSAVPTKPEETAPTTVTPPPVTPPAQANDDVREAISSLTTKVEELSGMVTGILASGGGQQDETPVRKPWTHWGGKNR